MMHYHVCANCARAQSGHVPLIRRFNSGCVGVEGRLQDSFVPFGAFGDGTYVNIRGLGRVWTWRQRNSVRLSALVRTNYSRSESRTFRANSARIPAVRCFVSFVWKIDLNGKIYLMRCWNARWKCLRSLRSAGKMVDFWWPSFVWKCSNWRKITATSIVFFWYFLKIAFI